MVVQLPPNGAIQRAGAPIRALESGIVDADPEGIEQYAQQLAAKAEAFKKAAAQLRDSQQELARAWPGGTAARGAQSQFTGLIEHLLGSAAQLDQTVGNLTNAAKVLRATQAAYSSMVGAANPAVAALLSHWTTRPAGHAMAQSVTASLGAYFTTAQKILEFLGLKELAGVAGSLNTISTNLETVFAADKSLVDRIGAGIAVLNEGKSLVEKLTSAGDAAAPASADAVKAAEAQVAALGLPGTADTAGLPAGTTGLTAAPPMVADGAVPGTGTGGYQGGYAAGYTAAQAAQLGQLTGAAPAGLSAGSYESGYAAGYAAATGGSAAGAGSGLAGATNTWVPVDATSLAGTTPPTGGGDAGVSGSGGSSGGSSSSSSGGSSGADHAVISSTYGDVSVAVELPTDQPMEFAMTVDTNGSADGGEVSQNITIDADRRVTVS